jgi:hypothetical protein
MLLLATALTTPQDTISMELWPQVTKLLAEVLQQRGEHDTLGKAHF